MALPPDEKDLIAKLSEKLDKYRAINRNKTSYYEGSHIPAQVGFAVPPAMKNNAPHVGWAGVVVDALEERLNFLGWNDPSKTLGLDEVYSANHLDVEASLAHLDALIFGTGFVEVGAGQAGEPNPLVTIEPTMNITGEWNPRTHQLSSALAVDYDDDGKPAQAALFLPNQTITLGWASTGWAEVLRDIHHLGRVPVVMLPNWTSGSMRQGRSEITAPVRDLVDEAARVLLSMAVNREFFSGPQRIVMGVAPDDIDKWKALTTGIWTIEPDSNGDLPTIDTFPKVEPGAHIDQLHALAAQMATTTGVPGAYFGLTPTANPSSADAIRASEVRLIKKAERRCAMFGKAWLEVAELILLVRDGQVPPEFAKVSCRWADPATPTAAAKADEAAKLVGAGILPATSSVTLDRIGLTTTEQTQVAADRAATPTMTDVLAGVAGRHDEPADDTEV